MPKCNIVRIEQDADEGEHQCNVHVRRNTNKMGREEINIRRMIVQARRSEGRLCGLHTER